MSEINQDIISKKSLKKRQKQIKKYKNEIKLNQDQEEVSKNKFDLNCNSTNDLPNKFTSKLNNKTFFSLYKILIKV
jgi:hypothetical protein